MDSSSPVSLEGKCTFLGVDGVSGDGDRSGWGVVGQERARRWTGILGAEEEDLREDFKGFPLDNKIDVEEVRATLGEGGGELTGDVFNEEYRGKGTEWCGILACWDTGGPNASVRSVKWKALFDLSFRVGSCSWITSSRDESLSSSSWSGSSLRKWKTGPWGRLGTWRNGAKAPGPRSLEYERRWPGLPWEWMGRGARDGKGTVLGITSSTVDVYVDGEASEGGRRRGGRKVKERWRKAGRLLWIKDAFAKFSKLFAPNFYYLIFLIIEIHQIQPRSSHARLLSPSFSFWSPPSHPTLNFVHQLSPAPPMTSLNLALAGLYLLSMSIWSFSSYNSSWK